MAVITYVTTIQFDFGTVALMREECRRPGIKRPLPVTDAGVRAAGLLECVTAQFGSATPLTVFDHTPSNPTDAAAREASPRTAR